MAKNEFLNALASHFHGNLCMLCFEVMIEWDEVCMFPGLSSMQLIGHAQRCYNPTLQHRVMVTAGANQAFVNLVLTLLDSQDSVVLFAPYYFNHLMAIQVGAFYLPLCPTRDLNWAN